VTKRFGTPGPRSLHPTFASSRGLARCKTLARLLFACLIATADDQGRVCGDAADLRALFRLQESQDTVEEALAELVDGGMVKRYEADGQPLVQLVSWWLWQSSQRRAYPSRHPGPTGWHDLVYGFEGYPPTFAAARGEMPQDAAERRDLTPDAALPVPVPDHARPKPKGTVRGSAPETSGDEFGWTSDEDLRPFRDAWYGRGLALPPTSGQLKSMLELIRRRPRRTAEWVSEPSRGTKAAEVVGHVFARSKEADASDVAQSKADEEEARRRHDADRGPGGFEPLAQILARRAEATGDPLPVSRSQGEARVERDGPDNRLSGRTA
jgi:hypothetical protein